MLLVIFSAAPPLRGEYEASRSNGKGVFMRGPRRSWGWTPRQYGLPAQGRVILIWPRFIANSDAICEVINII